MKTHVLVFALILCVALFSCNSAKKSDEIAGYTSPVKEAQPGVSTQSPGVWVKEGMTCYGVVVGIDKDGIPLNGKPVKAKVVSIKGHEVKMKALESVSLSEVKGCTKLGIKKNETWVEKEGDLFQTEEEAINFLKEKKIYLKS